MKKTFASVAMALILSCSTAFAAEVLKFSERILEYGSIQVYDFGGIKLHAYQTDDPMSDECFVLETDKNLVAIESPAFDENIRVWKQYVNGLNKPLTDILIFYHPAGGKWYGQARSHATETAQKSISEGSTKALTKSLGEAFGTGFNSDIPAIDSIIKSGSNTIGGVDFEVIDVGDGYNIVIPAINAIYTHLFGANTHFILIGQKHIEAVLTSLDDMKTNGPFKPLYSRNTG